jgi:DNA-binding NtrC family response regulator
MEIRLSPLSERREDIPLLVHYFLDKYALQESKRTRGISRTALQRLCEYSWPGNIRELEKCMRVAVASNNEVLFSWDFPSEIQRVTLGSGAQESEKRGREGETEQPQAEQQKIKSKPKTLEQVQREHICEVLEYTKGNKTAAHQFLGRSRQTLLKKMDKYKIPREYGEAEHSGKTA